MFASRRALVAVTVLFLLLTAGCGDDGATPEVLPALTGTVTDAAGEPVAGASVGLIYRLEETPLPDDWEKAATEIRFFIAETSLVRMDIHDYTGKHVRALIEDEREAGEHAVVWNSLDDDEEPVAPGLYEAFLYVDDSLIATKILFYFNFDLDQIPLAPHAVTDSRGRFSVPREIIPTGAEVPYMNQDDFVIMDRVSSRVEVVAVWFDGGTSFYASGEVSLPPETEHETVDLVDEP